MSIAKYWTVRHLDKKDDNVKHDDLNIAINEAKRLAALSPTKMFIVLESIDAYTCKKPIVEQIEIKEF